MHSTKTDVLSSAKNYWLPKFLPVEVIFNRYRVIISEFGLPCWRKQGVTESLTRPVRRILPLDQLMMALSRFYRMYCSIDAAKPEVNIKSRPSPSAETGWQKLIIIVACLDWRLLFCLQLVSVSMGRRLRPKPMRLLTSAARRTEWLLHTTDGRPATTWMTA